MPSLRALLSVFINMEQDHFLRLKFNLDLKVPVCVRRHPLHLNPRYADRLQILDILAVQLCLISEPSPLVQDASALLVERSLLYRVFPFLRQPLSRNFISNFRSSS